jgi:hypothetical protein
MAKTNSDIDRLKEKRPPNNPIRNKVFLPHTFPPRSVKEASAHNAANHPPPRHSEGI